MILHRNFWDGVLTSPNILNIYGGETFENEWNAFLELVTCVSVYMSYKRLLVYAIIVSLVFSHYVTDI